MAHPPVVVRIVRVKRQPSQRPDAEIITLQEACRRVGISIDTALKLMPDHAFPAYFWLGGRRVIARRAVEAWVSEKVAAATKQTSGSARR